MKSIKLRLNLRQAVIQTLIITIFSIAIYKFVEQQLIAEFDKNIETLANAGSLSVEAEFEHGRLEIEIEEERVPKYNKDTTVFLLHKPNKKIALNPNQINLSDWQLPSLPKSGYLTGHTTMHDGRSARYRTLRFLPPEEHGITYKGDDWFVTIINEDSSVHETLNRLLLSCIGLGFIATTLSLVANYFSIRNGLKPLHSIGEQLSQLEAKDMDHQLPTSKFPSELQPISEKLNELFQRINHSFQREQRFTSNAAHELRTPLAELQAILQVGTKWQPEDLPLDNPVEYFADGNTVTKRMSLLLDTLFTLSRDSSTLSPSSPSTFCLETELKRMISNLSESRRITVRSNASSTINTDKELLMASASNLIHNAIKHSTGDILVELQNSKKEVTLRVINTASDLKQEDLPFLSEPFWRKQKSRADQDHLGLGLNLVESFCSRQGWTLTFSLDGEQQLYAEISEIPLA